MNVQRPNRDEYKRIVNVVKTVLGVKYHTRSLGRTFQAERTSCPRGEKRTKSGKGRNFKWSAETGSGKCDGTERSRGTL